MRRAPNSSWTPSDGWPPGNRRLRRRRRPQAAAPATATTYRIRFEPAADFFRSGNDPLRMFRVLGELGELKASADISRLPADADFDPEACYLAWSLELTTSAPRAEIEEVFAWAGEESRVGIEADAPGRASRRCRRAGPSAARATGAQRRAARRIPMSARSCAPTGCT